MSSNRNRIVAIGIATALAGAAAVPALTTAQSPTARTITVQEANVQVAMDDVAPKSRGNRVSLGDRLTTRQSLFNASKARIGTLYTDCTSVGPTAQIFNGALLLCTLSYRFADGQISASGVFSLTKSIPVPITGGTGAYAGAEGTIAPAKPLKGYDSADLITITG